MRWCSNVCLLAKGSGVNISPVPFVNAPAEYGRLDFLSVFSDRFPAVGRKDMTAWDVVCILVAGVRRYDLSIVYSSRTV